MPLDARAAPPHRAGSLSAFEPWAWDPAASPASPGAAEEGVRLAYRAAGLAPPQIVWCHSPIQLAGQWARAEAAGWAGANVKRAVFDRPYGEGQGRIEALSLRAASPARHPPMSERKRAMGAAVAEAVLEAVGRTKPPLLVWLGGSRRRWLRSARRPLFAASGCGPAELSGASLLAYIQEAHEGTTSDALHALRLIAENVGWIVPHERTCWLSERPDLLRTDTAGRLHCSSGPALRYRDGWRRFAWKGVIVPAWVIERPHEITLDWIDAEIAPAVRHAMIDIFTAERFIEEGAASAIAWDAHGVLWGREWTHRGVVIDTWRAVQCSGASSRDPIIQPVPAHIRSPAEAVNWLLGPPASHDYGSGLPGRDSGDIRTCPLPDGGLS